MFWRACCNATLSESSWTLAGQIQAVPELTGVTTPAANISPDRYSQAIAGPLSSHRCHSLAPRYVPQTKQLFGIPFIAVMLLQRFQ